MKTFALALPLALLAATATFAASPQPPTPSQLADYFASETRRLETRCLANLPSLQDWPQIQAEYRRQLSEMLGLWPLPARTPLQPVITGRLEQPDCTIEKLHFQSRPGLYVTANLYLPKNLPRPAPAILYVCGHAQVKTNGLSCGNKTAYQHHGLWFARHGYVCLLIDTLQLGEIEGLHHGTHREGLWWWNARGYSPAGVEAWNAIRALDYLESRPEVDPARLGMTGRSGGGSYTWTTAALDPRIRAAAPVAGLTDLRNHVVDGCIEGHCDCMFFVNTYRWDFPLNAALLAPRPLLLVNTDADSIFPLDGVIRTHAKLRPLYQRLGQPDHLGLVIGPGPHKDTQDLQVPVLRWFNRHLQGEDPPIADAALKRLDPLELRVFGDLPTDQINTRIHESFVPAAQGPPPTNALELLRARSFAAWPADQPLTLQGSTTRYHDLRCGAYTFQPAPHVTLPLWIIEPARPRRLLHTEVHVLGTNDVPAWIAGPGQLFHPHPATLPAANQAWADQLAQDLATRRTRLVWLAPRGVGPAPWGWDIGTKTDIHRRRRFMLLGQTLDGMRVWDIQQGLRAVAQLTAQHPAPITLLGRGPMGVNALYASLFSPAIQELHLVDLPSSHRDGPDYLNVLQILDLPDTLNLARTRCRVRLDLLTPHPATPPSTITSPSR